MNVGLQVKEESDGMEPPKWEGDVVISFFVDWPTIVGFKDVRWQFLVSFRF